MALEVLVTMSESLLGDTALGLRVDPNFWQLMQDSLVRTAGKPHFAHPVGFDADPLISDKLQCISHHPVFRLNT